MRQTLVQYDTKALYRVLSYFANADNEDGNNLSAAEIMLD